MLEKAKPRGQESDPWLSGAADGETRWTAKEHKETSWGDGNILFLDCGGDYMTLYICENSLKCTPKKENFAVCKLYPNKPDSKAEKKKPKNWYCEAWLFVVLLYYFKIIF